MSNPRAISSACCRKRTPSRRWGAAVGLLLGGMLLVPVRAPAQIGVPKAERQRTAARIEAVWDELLGLLASDVWGTAEWTRGIYLGVRLLSIGAGGVELMGSRFARARTPEAAFLAGAFLAVHGDKTDRWFVRRELETNADKRVWLRSALGNGRAITATLSRSRRWENATQYLPSSRGCTLLARDCMQSDDALVRRAGLLWGYWVPDRAYWRDVKRCARTDPERLTQRFAAALLRRAAAQE